jgi:hypothetical protein
LSEAFIGNFVDLLNRHGIINAQQSCLPGDPVCRSKKVRDKVRDKVSEIRQEATEGPTGYEPTNSEKTALEQHPIVHRLSWANVVGSKQSPEGEYRQECIPLSGHRRQPLIK